MEGVRQATTDDVARIAALADAWHTELLELRGGPLWSRREGHAGPFDVAYAALLEREDTLVVVGTIDDVIVGFGVCRIETLRDGGRLGIVTDLYVEPEARGVSIGDVVINALVERCRDAGCEGVDAAALPGARAAKNFFETHGFTARALVMHHKLT